MQGANMKQLGDDERKTLKFQIETKDNTIMIEKKILIKSMVM